LEESEKEPAKTRIKIYDFKTKEMRVNSIIDLVFTIKSGRWNRLNRLHILAT
jgi:hypothetical protein